MINTDKVNGFLLASAFELFGFAFVLFIDPVISEMGGWPLLLIFIGFICMKEEIIFLN